MSKVMISLPEELLQQVDAEVERRGTTRSALLADAARAELARPDSATVRAAMERSEARFLRSGAFDSVDLVRADRDRLG
jgi:metal-responsive CopG/Arc/MetJ family transcriptional regulator